MFLFSPSAHMKSRVDVLCSPTSPLNTLFFSICPSPLPTTSFLTATTLVYAFRAGITAAAGTRLSLWSLLKNLSILLPLPLKTLMCFQQLFLVTTSLFQHWVIFAPAAFLRSGGHLSGPLSGTKPWSSVTRHHHRSPLYYHPQLIGQIFTCSLSYLYEILEIPSSLPPHRMVRFVSRSPSLVLALFSHPYPPCFLLTIQIHNCFNEPFAVILQMSSPSFTRKRSKESLALAWLNLLDKHMTTGRINQITILKQCFSSVSPEGDFRARGTAKS